MRRSSPRMTRRGRFRQTEEPPSDATRVQELGSATTTRSPCEPLDQCHGTGWSANLPLVNKVSEYIAWLRLELVVRIDARQVVRLVAVGPRADARRPGIEGLRRVRRLDRILALLQARIDEVR